MQVNYWHNANYLTHVKSVWNGLVYEYFEVCDFSFCVTLSHGDTWEDAVFLSKLRYQAGFEYVNI